MRRSAFTWIELIFVIVILGVIAAVALAKFEGMTDRAKEAKLHAMTGSLNRTSGAGFWFRSIDEGHHGSVARPEYDASFDQYITLIPDYTTGPSLVNCNANGTGVLLRYEYTDTYEIHCRDGDSLQSPKFRLYDVTRSLYID